MLQNSLNEGSNSRLHVKLSALSHEAFRFCCCGRLLRNIRPFPLKAAFINMRMTVFGKLHNDISVCAREAGCSNLSAFVMNLASFFTELKRPPRRVNCGDLSLVDEGVPAFS
jgi:hypothetical protein